MTAVFDYKKTDAKQRRKKIMKENIREENTMSKYYMVAEMTMEDGTVVLSDKFNHIKDAQGNIIHDRVLDMDYAELYEEYQYTNCILCAYEIKDFVEEYFKKKLNLDSVSEMDSFKFIFVNTETDEYSHYLEMNPIVKYIDDEITLHEYDLTAVIAECINQVNKCKDAILILTRKDQDDWTVQMQISEIREKSEKYYFIQDCNELQVRKDKICGVMVKIKDNCTQYRWLYKNGDVMDISVTKKIK